MECNRCGGSNRPTAHYCSECGMPLVRRCAACGQELGSSAKFCDECGTPTTAASLSVDPSAPAATRKTVTVLFTDLVGSTSFGERNDPEQTRTVMARYHALLQEVVDSHDGTVAKFMGDGMMATFGVPEVAEDDASRAVRAGIDIQRRFVEFASDVAAQHGEALALRVGVNTGEVVTADGDADLVGDALNVAARLESACRPGQVLVGEETWRLTRSEFAFVPLGRVTVAGRAGEVGAYELDMSHEPADDQGDSNGLFVGRAEEMDRLISGLQRARAERRAQLVTVLGSPGVGKTRLSRELTRYAVEHVDAHAIEVRCDRAGDSTFAPIAHLIRAALALDTEAVADTSADTTADTTVGEGPVDVRDRLERSFAVVGPDLGPDRARVFEVLASMIGSGEPRSVEETFWGIRRLIESMAATAPLVLVVDDIQWAQPQFLDLLEHLAEWTADAPVLLLCLARPELRDLRSSLCEPGRRVSDVVALAGLDAGATEQLAAALLGADDLPPALAARLPLSTEGNPLFVRELVRMLVDDSVIVRTPDGHWQLTIDADAVEVPPTIQSLLAARIERLSPEDRRVLEMASVVGAEFSLGALGALTGETVATTVALDHMRRRELVEPTGTYWGDDAVYRFHHVLIRDAAYRRILKASRAELHERVGDWLQDAEAELRREHQVAIAHHFEQASHYLTELGSDIEAAAGLGRRAAALLCTAATDAMHRDDLSLASSLAARALGVVPESDVAARADILIVACECALASGEVATASAMTADLTALVRHPDADVRLGAWAQCYAAQLIGLTDPAALVDAVVAAAEASRIFADAGDGSGEAKAHQVRAGLLARLGRVGEAEAALDQALAAARVVDDRSRVTAILGSVPVAALFGPSSVARAGGRCLDVVRLLHITSASPSVEATSMRCQAVLEALRGRFDVARSLLANARTSLEELGLRHGLLETDLFAGMVELIAGQPSAAVVPLRRAYDGLGSLGVGADAGRAAALLSRALLAQGDVDGADVMAAASEGLAGQNLQTAVAWRLARAEVSAAQGDLDGAIATAAEAVDIAASTDLTIDHADACAALAAFRGSAGDVALAASARREARHLYEAKGATVLAERLRMPAESAPIGSDPTDSAPTVVSGHLVDVREANDSVLASIDLKDDPEGAHDGLGGRRLAALRSVDQSSGSRRRSEVDNDASRMGLAWLDLFNDGDIDGISDRLSDDFESVNRRSIRMETEPTTAEEFIDDARLSREVFSECAAEVLAVRGERLALLSVVLRSDSGDEIAMLLLDEVDAAGRLARVAMFDTSDLQAALDDMESRSVLIEGAPIGD